jgi:hypothetical protein
MKKSNNKTIRDVYITSVIKLYKLFTDIGLREDSKCVLIAKSMAKKLRTWVTCEGRPGLERFKAISNACIRVILGQS